MTRRHLMRLMSLFGLAPLTSRAQAPATSAKPATAPVADWRKLTDVEWKSRLTPSQHAVLRREGTEPSHTSPLNAEKRKGVFHCAGCDQPLYRADTKFESGTGWPSFWDPIPGAIATTTDRSFFMTRTEAHCAKCGGHLGHVFPDGPRPTGQRYCMNGVSLRFAPK